MFKECSKRPALIDNTKLDESNTMPTRLSINVTMMESVYRASNLKLGHLKTYMFYLTVHVYNLKWIAVRAAYIGFLNNATSLFNVRIVMCIPVFPSLAKDCHSYTVETLYSTIYYSKYFIELHIGKSTQYVALWTHKRHPYLALSGELWSVFYEYVNRNWSCYRGFLLYLTLKYVTLMDMNICMAMNWVIISSYNRSVPHETQSLLEPMTTSCFIVPREQSWEICIKIQWFSLKKMYVKRSSTKRRQLFVSVCYIGKPTLYLHVK